MQRITFGAYRTNDSVQVDVKLATWKTFILIVKPQTWGYPLFNYGYLHICRAIRSGVRLCAMGIKMGLLESWVTCPKEKAQAARQARALSLSELHSMSDRHCFFLSNLLHMHFFNCPELESTPEWSLSAEGRRLAILGRNYCEKRIYIFPPPPEYKSRGIARLLVPHLQVGYVPERQTRKLPEDLPNKPYYTEPCDPTDNDLVADHFQDSRTGNKVRPSTAEKKLQLLYQSYRDPGILVSSFRVLRPMEVEPGGSPASGEFVHSRRPNTAPWGWLAVGEDHLGRCRRRFAGRSLLNG